MNPDVIIVGAGPVGLFLACELRLQDLSVLVVESQSQHQHESAPLKAAPFGQRGLSVATVETFFRRGLLHRLALPKINDMRGGHFAGLVIDSAKVQPRSPYNLQTLKPFGATLVEIERMLKHRAIELGAEIEYDFHVAKLEQTVTHACISDMQGRQRSANWLVGCDGGRSQIRRLGNFDFVGTEAHFTTYTALVKLSQPSGLQIGRVLTPTGFYMQPIPGFLSVMEFDGGRFDRRNAITKDHLQTVLRRVSQTETTIEELVLATSYTDRAKLTTELKRGRVLLAGDAAHVHSPLGGQGLNVGIGDALNLGWKLAAKIKSASDELETYFKERHPVADWVLEWTRAQVALLRPDPLSRAQRKIVEDLIATSEGATYFAEKIGSTDLRYDLGHAHPLVGRSCPDFELEDGSRVNDHMRDAKPLVIAFDERPAFLTAKPVFNLSRVHVRPDGVVSRAEDKTQSSPASP